MFLYIKKQFIVLELFQLFKLYAHIWRHRTLENTDFLRHFLLTTKQPISDVLWFPWRKQIAHVW